MKRLVDWVRAHKAATVLVLIAGYWVWGRLFGVSLQSYRMMSLGPGGGFESADVAAAPKMMGVVGNLIRNNEPPPSKTKERMVITDTNMSVVVKEVGVAIEQIKRKTMELGGYMVESSVSKPQESASGNITVRVPSRRLDEALAAFRAVGLRVVDERVRGQDVTDEFEDLDAKLVVLRKNKARMEEIMERATNVNEILSVQNQVFALQAQIDGLVGRQKYLAAAADLSKVVIYLSTDEFSLPYAPAQPWRPDVVFKLAVRSLVMHLRAFGTALIWLGVYSVIWVPLVGVYWWFVARRK